MSLITLSVNTQELGVPGVYAGSVTPGILIVDDHAGFRKQVRALLEAAGYLVIGEAEDAAGAVRAAGELHPETVLLDIQLPDGSGFSVADQIHADDEQTRIVFVSSREASDYGTLLEARPGDAFIHKAELSFDSLAEMVGPPG